MPNDQVTESVQRGRDARARLMAATGDLELSDAETRVLQWLTRWESETVDSLASVIEKARRDGYRAGTGTMA